MRVWFRKASYYVVITVVSISACAPRSGEPPAATAVTGSSRLSELLRADADAGYRQALAPRAFRFPADHGPHPGYRNEWWYFTGNLDADGGERFGFELTIFRFSVAPANAAPTGSAWQTNQVYIGHFAVTDATRKRFLVAQRYSRGSLGLAGAEATPFRVWVEDWEVRASDRGGLPGVPATWHLRAIDGDISLSLALVPVKPVVLNGDRGLSRKSAEPGNASYYYSIPRLQARGRLEIGNKAFAVSGLSWLDREWGSSALSRDQQGWDWFSLQLSDGNDLMFYKLRRTDGSTDSASAGTWIDADGNADALGAGDVTLSVTAYWHSARGGRYPSAWQIAVPGKNVSLSIAPVMPEQELLTNVRYWEGAVDVNGKSGGRTVDGRGYVELTGYAER